MISRTLIIGSSVLYCVPLVQPIGSSLVVTNSTAHVRVTLDTPVTLVIVQVELSTRIYVSHVATYVVNKYIY